jgi:hypothetical protein
VEELPNYPAAAAEVHSSTVDSGSRIAGEGVVLVAVGGGLGQGIDSTTFPLDLDIVA